MSSYFFSLLLALLNVVTLFAVDYDQIFEAKIPDGIVLRDCGYGLGLFATQPFKAGDVLYKNHYQIVKDVEKSYLLHTDQGDFPFSTTTHTVSIGNGNRLFYSFESFINHSCDPNTLTLSTPAMMLRNEYYQVAVKDIEVGEELFCDYNMFDYDCRDEGGIECRCGAAVCRKQIIGFKWLPMEEQLRLLPIAEPSIIKQFIADHPEYSL